ncbi:hypothetical protein [Burkholderia sp. PAMC 26561]|uniref:hypothetical protein n=1 Tax=Burkholderia sp. PAMC 26561 TaxID=1795043 RepID=UPI000B001A4D|nr:hypothetical protein [Burkholderia sp. PAMC 26561]
MNNADIERVFQALHDLRSDNPRFLEGVYLSARAVGAALARYEAVSQANGDMELRMFSGAHVDPAAPERSALLLRLLMVKRPLRHAQPTMFSYPHYILIEDPGPIGVVVRGPIPLGGLAARAGGAHGKYWFSVNDCLYACVDDNEAAQEVNRLLAGGVLSQFVSRQSLIAQGPAWVLRYGHWPAWTLNWDHDNEAQQYRAGWVLRKTPEWDDYCVDYLDI